MGGASTTTTEQQPGCPPQQAFPPAMEESKSSSETENDTSAGQGTGEETGNQELLVEFPRDAPVEEQQLTEEPPSDDIKFERGDHVYQWCSLLGIPGVFQHHGIVLYAQDIVVLEDGEEQMEQLLTIADFSNLLLKTNKNTPNSNFVNQEEEDEWLNDDNREQQQSNEEQTIRQQQTGTLTASSSGSSNPFKKSSTGGLRIYTTTSSKKWYKVQYESNWFRAHLWNRSGTCTPAKSDEPHVVLQRVQFLISQSQSVLPRYHSIFANCECVAVWCKTGTWSTLQAASMLSHAAVAQVKGTVTLAGVAAAQSVSVPAAGVWGWLGYSTTVPLLTVNPFIVPALCAYGAVTIGGPAVFLAIAKKKWNSTTTSLNKALEADHLQVELLA